jgi:hypothetical protein
MVRCSTCDTKSRNCKYTHTQAQRIVDSGRGPVKRILNATKCYPHVVAPSDVNTRKGCSERGARGTTPSGNRCTHSYSCSSARVESKAPGWNLISASCLRKKPSTKKKLGDTKSRNCKYTHTQAQRIVDSGRGPVKRILNATKCYPYVVAPSDVKTKKGCSERGARGTTPSGNRCTHSYSCSNDMVESKAPGWNLISASCLRKTSSKKNKKSDQPSTPAKQHRVGSVHVGRHGKKYKVFLKQGNETQGTYKAYRLQR